ncbi:hypothetical protein DFP72DRAFT_1066936 [Ephemerocybe angulata]|uniref:Protein kinase domain-containing protein n=1 Tax=Ephemerocybe angulata TaxID=980116 RepID=A0A8H6HZH1_9AGAR|nr:hypothetical protein DFP72DRAFT_1066936 [Tulosesus angulatus]
MPKAENLKFTSAYHVRSPKQARRVQFETDAAKNTDFGSMIRMNRDPTPTYDEIYDFVSMHIYFFQLWVITVSNNSNTASISYATQEHLQNHQFACHLISWGDDLTKVRESLGYKLSQYFIKFTVSPLILDNRYTFERYDQTTHQDITDIVYEIGIQAKNLKLAIHNGSLESLTESSIVTVFVSQIFPMVVALWKLRWTTLLLLERSKGNETLISIDVSKRPSFASATEDRRADLAIKLVTDSPTTAPTMKVIFEAKHRLLMNAFNEAHDLLSKVAVNRVVQLDDSRLYRAKPVAASLPTFSPSVPFPPTSGTDRPSVTTKFHSVSQEASGASTSTPSTSENVSTRTRTSSTSRASRSKNASTTSRASTSKNASTTSRASTSKNASTTSRASTSKDASTIKKASRTSTTSTSKKASTKSKTSTTAAYMFKDRGATFLHRTPMKTGLASVVQGWGASLRHHTPCYLLNFVSVLAKVEADPEKGILYLSRNVMRDSDVVLDLLLLEFFMSVFDDLEEKAKQSRLTLHYASEQYVFKFSGRFRFLSWELKEGCRTVSTRQGHITWTPFFVLKEFENSTVFEVECEALSALQGCRGILRMLGKGVSMRGKQCIVMEIGGRPTHLSTDEPSEWENVAPILKNIHAAGWHHHDLHGGNVLEDANGMLSIIDFGNAVRAELCTEDERCPDWTFMYGEEE